MDDDVKFYINNLNENRNFNTDDIPSVQVDKHEDDNILKQKKS